MASTMPVAELSCPHHAFKEHQKNQSPEGKEYQQATYHNWHSPFLWTQIVNAAKHPSVGWKMSTTNIVALLKRQDLVTFTGLAHTTVEGWIDHSGDKLKWSARALEMATKGNDPGLGKKGGKKGIFM